MSSYNLYNNRKNRSPLDYSDPLEADSYVYVDGRGFAPTPPVITERRMLQWCSNCIGFAIIFYIIFTFTFPNLILGIMELISPAFVYADGEALSSIAIELTDLISGNLSLLLPFMVFLYISHIPIKRILPFRSIPLSVTVPSLFIALGCSVIGYSASMSLSGFMSVFSLEPVMGEIMTPTETLPLIIFLLNICILAPVVEEVVFRGVIMNTLRRFGDCFALLISSLLFALVHMNLVQIPNAFIMGLVIGYFTMYSGSIWTGIGIHILNNLLTMGINGLISLLPDQSQMLSLLAVYTFYIMTAVIAFLLLLKNHPDVFYFHRSSTLSTERKKYITFFSAMTMLCCLVVLILFIISNIRVI